jgi:myosin-5
LRRECCSFSNGEYIRAGLTQIKHWCNDVNQEFADSAWEALRHIRQAVDFLVISLKPIRTWSEICDDVCPALSLQQLERIVGMYWDDMNGTNIISAEFTSSMRTMMKEESNNATSFSVLLDDDSRFSTMLKSFHGHSPFPFSAHLTSVDYLCSIPFSLEDIAKSMPTIEETTENDLLPFVRENQSFAFILHRRD